MGIKTKKYNLPVNYNELERHQRTAVRKQYIKEQNNLCQYCKRSLDGQPDDLIYQKGIRWDLFPDNFQDYPIHLHHNHETGMTIGAVHMKCNAYLWQYKGK